MSLSLYLTATHSFTLSWLICSARYADTTDSKPIMDAPSSSQLTYSSQQDERERVMNFRLAQPRPSFVWPCNNCGENASWKRCKSTENGNQGRWIARCNGYNPETETVCSFVRWAPGATSPKVSPVLGSPPAVPVVAAVPRLVPVSQPMRPKDATILLLCIAFVCQKRPHSACDRGACRKHCGLLGGCSLKGHPPAAVLQLDLELRTDPQVEDHTLPVEPPTMSSSGEDRSFQPAHAPSPTAHDDCEDDIPVPCPLASPSRPHAADVVPPRRVDKGKGRAIDLPPVPSTSHPHPPPAAPRKGRAPGSAPRYATQMPPAFTAQNAREEEIEEEQRQRDREQIQAAQRAKNNVLTYAWTEDGLVPMIYEFQDGFKLPRFFFTIDVLRKLGLDPTRPVQRYNRLLDIWTHFDVGHMVTLMPRDNGILLVKQAHVSECKDFDQHLSKLERPGSPNIIQGLPNERKFMRAASRARSSRPGSPSTVGVAVSDEDERDEGPVPTIHARCHNGRRTKGPVRPAKHACLDSIISISDDDDTAPVPARPRPAKHARLDSVISLSDDDNSAPVPTHPPMTTRLHSRSPSIDSMSSSSSSGPVVVPTKRTRSRSRHAVAHPVSQRRSPSVGSFVPLDAPTSSWAESNASHSPSPSSSEPIVKTESSGSLLSRGGSRNKPIEVENVIHWPVDFYAVDVGQGFVKCRLAAEAHRSVPEAFAKHFGVPFKSTTFYDNRRVWDWNANKALKKRFVQYGRTRKGLWSAFMKVAERPS
ncbi:hypothetical protein BV22DRAFT_1127940 [Leucogyrophana mollusca]|uniref:Uncharacterized protein n=1 Tax=Leucogyrophana mollusca TaxID=85980 RepID=A0ACB8BPA6_9AGAM|nr:hypothetical protein BV22DRAFT_1127940 [Leucogyrophana mollusca]